MSMIQHGWTRGLLQAAAVAAVVAIAVAGAPKAGAAGDQLDSRTKTVLADVQRFLEGKKTIQFTMEVDSTLSLRRSERVTESRLRIVAERPNRAAVIALDEESSFSAAANGKDFVIHVIDEGSSYELPAPESLGDFALATAEFASPLQLASGEHFLSLVAEKPLAALIEVVTESRFAGTEKVGDVECARVQLKSEHADFDIWVTTDDQPRILKVRPQPVGLFANVGATAAELQSLSLSAEIRFADYKFDEEIPAETFVLAKDDDLRDDSEWRLAPEEDLEGEEVPEFELDTVDGGLYTQDKITSAGQPAVVSFFMLSEPASARAIEKVRARVQAPGAKPVTHILVNQEDEKARVKSFLDRIGAKETCLLDVDAEMNGEFFVESHPSTVTIDAQGNIRKLFAGFAAHLMPAFDDELTLLTGTKAAADGGTKPDAGPAKDDAATTAP